MNIDDLQAFLAVAKLGSFSRAGEELHLTQPAISKRIAALEDELDTRLFDRIGRHIGLTEAGRALLGHAEKILAEVEDGRRAIGNLAGQVGGRLSLATSHHIGLHRLPPVLRAFTRRYPEVRLDLRFMDSEAACRAVAQGELELAIVTLPRPGTTGLEVLPVWQDALHLVTATDHPLCRQKRFNLADLRRYPAILPAHGTFTRELIEQRLGTQAHELQVALETNYLETIKMMVSIGLGWSVLPETMLDRSLHVWRRAGLTVQRSLGVVRHPQRTLSNAARALMESCVA